MSEAGFAPGPSAPDDGLRAGGAAGAQVLHDSQVGGARARKGQHLCKPVLDILTEFHRGLTRRRGSSTVEHLRCRIRSFG